MSAAMKPTSEEATLTATWSRTEPPSLKPALCFPVLRGALLAALAAFALGAGAPAPADGQPAVPGKAENTTQKPAVSSATNYDEPYRPQFHFSAARGFLGDPEISAFESWWIVCRSKSSAMVAAFR